MKPIRLRPWHYSCMQLALAGADAAQIAGKLNQPKSRVARFLASEECSQEMSRFNEAVMIRIAQERIDPIVKFQSLLETAIDKLEQKLNCGDDKTEYLAACRIIDNAGLSPVRRMVVQEDEIFRQLSRAEMVEAAQTGRIPARLSGVRQIASTVLAKEIADAEASQEG